MCTVAVVVMTCMLVLRDTESNFPVRRRRALITTDDTYLRSNTLLIPRNGCTSRRPSRPSQPIRT